ncbi:BadF/BadG/BcrA/BcrD ATPase family protein [Falsiroseomonas sp.]|uniref:BadF/BadG/BcrA/BcrD ATPase family protein n=1 Tax=Falsiroseomonas sp. TaxID=2870721 RepID=UPI003568BE0A
MKLVGMDVGSTTVKAVLVEDGRVLWQDYQRHNTRQAEKVLDFLGRMQAEAGLTPGEGRIFFTGSGAGLIAPLVGGKFIQEVVAVAAAVEKLHPDVLFVSEIGGEDMKTIFFKPAGDGRSKQVFMQSACSGGTGTFIEKTARKLQVPPEALAAIPYDGQSLHKISSKCGIFAETDANTLVKGGVPVEEIIASLFEAVVYQNLATLTKGNTPLPEVLLLGGPNLFFTGLQQAWRRHLGKLWQQREVALPEGKTVEALIRVPAEALYYAALGCVEIGAKEPAGVAVYLGADRLRWWIEIGQHEQKAKEGARGLVAAAGDLERFLEAYGAPRNAEAMPLVPEAERVKPGRPVMIGCDFGSTTTKAVVISPEREMLFSCYVPSKGNPIEDAQRLLRQIREAGFTEIGALALTGYGKDLLKDIIGADVGVVETVAHAKAALHFFPDADVICDVGGTDVKVMILRQGTVSDFRLNSQCSSGNGAFLQGVADRYNIPLHDYAEKAFQAQAMPTLAMGCGVFLQSDIVNQQRKGWSAEEIMASLAAVLPLNVWVYAGQLQNLRAVGRKFVLQGGTHRNMAVVKAQVDFITAKVPDAAVFIHPYSGEAGAIGAALCALEHWQDGAPTRFRGFAAIEALAHRSTTNAHTVCNWCPVNCKRTFIDVQLPGGEGRAWSKVPVEAGWERVISGNSCPKGLVEDANEMRAVKARMEEQRRVHPNLGELVREEAFIRARAESAVEA